jgi:protein-S-isoprenylcysteine O-methyltransferase Ste14
MASRPRRIASHRSGSNSSIRLAGWVLTRSSTSRRYAHGSTPSRRQLLIPLAIPEIRKEEQMLVDEFGEEYAAYKRRTWMLPFVR